MRARFPVVCVEFGDGGGGFFRSGFGKRRQPFGQWGGGGSLVGFRDQDIFGFGDARPDEARHFLRGKGLLGGDEE